MESPATSQHLVYAPPPPWHRRHRIRLLAALAVVAVAVFLGDGFGGRVWHRARLLCWQRQCLAYAPPKDLVAYEQAGTNRTFHQPACWSTLRAHAPVPPISPPVLFLGERKTTDGKDVLVVVHGLSVPPGVEVIEPATWTAPPRAIRPTQVFIGLGWRHPGTGAPRDFGEFNVSSDARRYFGRPHPTDATRVTIPLRGPDDPRAVEVQIGDGGRFASFRLLGMDDVLD